METMKNITINMIEESLLSLDTEYREALAHCLMDKKYLSASPLELSMGSEKQQKELDTVYNKPLNKKEVKEIIDYISNEMKSDFQYNQFKSIISLYDLKESNIEEDLEIER